MVRITLPTASLKGSKGAAFFFKHVISGTKGWSHLGGGEVVAVPVAHDLSLPSHVVVGDGLPPDARLGQPHLSQLGQDDALALGVQQVDPDRRVIALDEVHEVQHTHKRHLGDDTFTFYLLLRIF